MDGFLGYGRCAVWNRRRVYKARARCGQMSLGEVQLTREMVESRLSPSLRSKIDRSGKLTLGPYRTVRRAEARLVFALSRPNETPGSPAGSRIGTGLRAFTLFLFLFLFYTGILGFTSRSYILASSFRNYSIHFVLTSSSLFLSISLTFSTLHTLHASHNSALRTPP